jgi:large subunit ribosomal protein L9
MSGSAADGPGDPARRRRGTGRERHRSRGFVRLPEELPAAARPAQPASPGALEDAIRRKEAADKAEREAIARSAETAKLLSKTVLTIQHRAGEDGKLYGSVTTKEIAEAIKDARGLKVDRRKIRLDVPIHQVGTYMIEVEIPGGATASVKTIVAEEK